MSLRRLPAGFFQNHLLLTPLRTADGVERALARRLRSPSAPHLAMLDTDKAQLSTNLMLEEAIQSNEVSLRLFPVPGVV